MGGCAALQECTPFTELVGWQSAEFDRRTQLICMKLAVGVMPILERLIIQALADRHELIKMWNWNI